MCHLKSKYDGSVSIHSTWMNGSRNVLPLIRGTTTVFTFYRQETVQNYQEELNKEYRKMLGEALLYWFKISLPFLSFFDSTSERSSRDSQMHSRKRIILLPSNPNENLLFAIFLFMRWRSLSNKLVVYSTSKKSHHGRTWVICTKNASTTYTQAQQQCSSTGKNVHTGIAHQTDLSCCFGMQIDFSGSVAF